MAPERRGLGKRRFISLCVGAFLGGVGVLLLALTPTVAGDIAQAKTLAARGVQVPLVSATFTTTVQRATRASGSDSCSISGVTVRYAFLGTTREAKLREATGDDLPTCADALAAARELDYAPGTPLLVDPQDPSSVALASEVAKQTADAGRADGTLAGGIVFLVLAALLGLSALLPLRRNRAPRYPGPPWSGPPNQPFGPSFGPPAPPPITSRNGSGGSRHRSLGEQLHRSPRVLHASWLTGLAVVLAGATAGGFSVAGVLFLAVVFLPIVVAYRRDRLSFAIVFASLFLPAWPWAMYKAASRLPQATPAAA